MLLAVKVVLSLLLACLVATAHGGILDRVYLLPINRDGWGAPGPEALGQKSGPLSAEELAVFRRTADGPWKSFADDLVSFELPDDPLIHVDVLTPEGHEPIAIVGGAVGTADRSFERAYRLSVGPKRLPWLSIFVRDAEGFDDGICLCGAIVFKKLLVADGTCLEFSLLESGMVKKVQALGAKHRAILMEWTHSVITQEAYARVGASVRLKTPGAATADEWRERLGKSDDELAPLGWIDPGDSSDRVQKLVGEPLRKEGETWVYVREQRQPQGDGWRTTARVPVPGGVFTSFGAGWKKGEEMEPIRGSVNWAHKLAEASGNKRISKADLTLAVTAFLEKCDANGGEDWPMWTQALSELFRHGLIDERVVGRVRASFLDLKRKQHHGAWILETSAAKDRAALFEKRAWLILKSDVEPSIVTDELWNLLSFLGSTNPAIKPIVRAALRYPIAQVRHTGVICAKVLPPDEARSSLLFALDDTDDSVRHAAVSSLKDVTKADDLAWLHERLDRETNEQLMNELLQLTHELERTKTAPTPKRAQKSR